MWEPVDACGDADGLRIEPRTVEKPQQAAIAGRFQAQPTDQARDPGQIGPHANRAQRRRRQIRLTMGGQHQKTDVLHRQLQPARPFGGIPSDPLFTRICSSAKRGAM